MLILNPKVTKEYVESMLLFCIVLFVFVLFFLLVTIHIQLS